MSAAKNKSVPDSPAGSFRPSAKRIVVGIAYLAVLAGLVWGVRRARQWAISTYGGERAQGEWDNWREEAAKLSSSDGPVTRRVPRSQQPPAFVLLTEYYGMCLAAAIIFGSGLYFMLAFALIGALTPVRESRRE